MSIENTTIFTEEQGELLTYLYRYSQKLCKFSNYELYSKWIKENEMIETAINSLIYGNYTDDITIEEYINDCILNLEEAK